MQRSSLKRWVCFRTRRNFFAKIFFHCQAWETRSFSMSVHCFLAIFRTFYGKLGRLSLFFSKERHIFDKKNWSIKSAILIIKTRLVNCYFSLYYLINFINLWKRHELFKKPPFEKMPIFPTKKLKSCLCFWADWKSRCITHIVFKLFAIIHSPRLWNDFEIVTFREESFFYGKRKSFILSGWFDFCNPDKWKPEDLWGRCTECLQNYSSF